MDNEPLTTRQQRAFAIVRALRARIERLAGPRWIVPSQTDPASKYVVNVDARTCTCRDHEDRGVACKHVLAVEIVRANVTLPDGTTVTARQTRVTYKQEWPSYNAAQTNERTHVQLLLRGLCDGIVQPPYKGNGRRPLPLADIVYGAAMKVYGGMSGRRSMSDLRAVAADGLVTKVPCYNTLFNYLDDAATMTPLLKMLVHEAASPLRPLESAFATDATGIATKTYVRWFDHKWGGERKELRWLKLHAQVGVDTNAIVSVAATPSDVGDAPMAIPLLESSVHRGWNVTELSLDKAYLSNAILKAVEDLGSVPYVPFKLNSKPTGKTDAWCRLWHRFESAPEDTAAHYHLRSNVESTFSAMKRLFGASVRAKTADAQINEALLKCLCFNLTCVVHATYKCGIEPSFWAKLEAA